jgi:hypothetical protein
MASAALLALGGYSDEGGSDDDGATSTSPLPSPLHGQPSEHGGDETGMAAKRVRAEAGPRSKTVPYSLLSSPVESRVASPQPAGQAGTAAAVVAMGPARMLYPAERIELPVSVGPAARELADRVDALVFMQRQHRRSLNAEMAAKKTFRNPTIYDKLIAMLRLEERGSNLAVPTTAGLVAGMYVQLGEMQREHEQRQAQLALEQQQQQQQQYHQHAVPQAGADGGRRIEFEVSAAVRQAQAIAARLAQQRRSKAPP